VRIIAGSAKGRPLQNFSGDKIRPTSDRVREAVFSILFSRIGSWQGKTVLDLYAGTGAMAIEALSRGAARAVLVEQDAAAEKLARANLQTCQLDRLASQIRGSLPGVLEQLSPEQKFDVVFLDPPYDRELADQTLHILSGGDLLRPGGRICVETGSKEQLQPQYGNLALELERRYGSTRVSLFSTTE
jgi:16S rRNA (guanine(966)-N(2))-methyltransferase RsmD